MLPSFRARRVVLARSLNRIRLHARVAAQARFKKARITLRMSEANLRGLGEDIHIYVKADAMNKVTHSEATLGAAQQVMKQAVMGEARVGMSAAQEILSNLNNAKANILSNLNNAKAHAEDALNKAKVIMAKSRERTDSVHNNEEQCH